MLGLKDIIDKIKNIFSIKSKPNESAEAKNSEELVPSIVFVNKPITDIAEDIVGFDTQINTIKEAINDGADMIALVADYGAGKSSIADILYKNDKSFQKTRINLWDSISIGKIKKEGYENGGIDEEMNDNISLLTKSFLYQLANGYDSKEENALNLSKLTTYVTKRLSNSHNLISFASSSDKLWGNLLISTVLIGIFLVLYYGEKLSCFFNSSFMTLLRDISPAFLITGIAVCIWSIREAAVAFTNIKNSDSKKAEINDVFDVYDIIARKLADNACEAKQIVIIEDLDRIVDKKLIIGFLKEIYRFHNLLSENIRKEFVFIIALKPESSLIGEFKEDNNHMYSKLFDLIVYLKPIHLSDYESVLLNLINSKTNKKQKERLVQLLTNKEYSKDNDIFKDRLPAEFKWIVQGDNLTIRLLKDRLNQAIDIMVSLKNKNYSNVPNNAAIKFERCAAVAYLEAAFPEEYYSLIKNEKAFSKLIQESYKVKRNEEKINYQEKLLEKLEENYKDSHLSETFKDIIIRLIIDGILDEDFKMYFYTHPKNIYIKNVDEKFVCDAIMLPYDNNISEEELSVSVERIWKQDVNVVVPVLEKCALNKELHWIIYRNDLLLAECLKIDFEQTVKILCDRIFESIDNFKKFIPLLTSIYKNERIEKRDVLIENFVFHLYYHFIENKIDNNLICSIRKNLSELLIDNIELCNRLYFDEEDSGCIPIISNEELTTFEDRTIGLSLIDISLIDYENFDYIFFYINSEKLCEKEVAEAAKIIKHMISVIPHDVIYKPIFDFLYNNVVFDRELFEIVMAHLEQSEQLCNYLNEIEEHMDIDTLIIIDDKCLKGELSEELLSKLKNSGLYKTYLLSCSVSDLQNFDYDESSEALKGVLNIISEKYTKEFIHIRSIVISKSKNIGKFSYLFDRPYPLITKEELYIPGEFGDTISLINGKQITENDVGYITEFFNETATNSKKCALLFEYLFDVSNIRAVTDNAIIKVLFSSMNFNKIPFNSLEMDAKEKYITIFKPLLTLSQPQSALDFMIHTFSLVESLEKILIANASFHSKYKDLFNEINFCTKTTIAWIKTQSHFALNSYIRNELLQEGLEEYYVVSRFMYEKEFLYEPEKVKVDTYAMIYKNRAEMFDWMKKSTQFLVDMMENELYYGLNVEKTRPLYEVSQTFAFAKYVLDTFEVSEKKYYLSHIGAFSDIGQAADFEQLITSDAIMDISDDYAIKDKVLESLPTQGLKISYGKRWNAKWKDIIKKREEQKFLD